MNYSSREACERTGIPRNSLNFWSDKVGVKPAEVRNVKNTLVKFWTADAVRKMKTAYGRRQRRRAKTWRW